mgnify:CR=1 FL=1
MTMNDNLIFIISKVFCGVQISSYHYNKYFNLPIDKNISRCAAFQDNYHRPAVTQHIMSGNPDSDGNNMKKNY